MEAAGSTTSADRLGELLRHAPRSGGCLEIAPFHRPALRKGEFDVDYVDYTTTAELRRKAPAGVDPAAVCAVDFIWHPGRRLRDCVPQGKQYDFACASHVMEHVPNVLDWVQQILDVLRPGAVLQLALPEKDGCFDVFRRTTDFATLLEHWVWESRTPTPGQIYDFLSHNVAVPADPPGAPATGQPFGPAPAIENCTRHYTDEAAFHFAMRHFADDTYMDTHCSVFTQESLVRGFSTARQLGILNIEIMPPVAGWREFFVAFRKLGEPRVRREQFRRVGPPPAA
jgi:SAM-dependent methyltransferase